VITSPSDSAALEGALQALTCLLSPIAIGNLGVTDLGGNAMPLAIEQALHRPSRLLPIRIGADDYLV